MVLAMWYSIKG